MEEETREEMKRELDGCADKLNACREVLSNPTWKSTTIGAEALRGLAGILEDVESDLRGLMENDDEAAREREKGA